VAERGVHNFGHPAHGNTLARQADQPTAGVAVLVVDDCCLYREGLASLVEREPDVCDVRCADDWPAIVTSLEHRVPDVVLVNLASVESHALMTALRLQAPSARIVAIGVGDSEQEIIACAEAGIAGYLLRSEPFSHLIRLVRHVVAGEAVCSPRVTAALMRRLATLAEERRQRVPVLTEREDQILGLLDIGLSNQQIADRLCIELRTVKNHVHHILGKLGVSRRGEAVAAIRSIRAGTMALGSGLTAR
jgi:DNA-binding NarL/FixJ family response regulator